MKALNILEVIKYLSNLSVLVPIFFYLKKIKVLPKENRIIGIFVFVSAFCDLIGFWLYYNRIQTGWVANFYYNASFVVLCFYYHHVVFRFKNRKYFYLGIIVFLISNVIINAQQSFNEYQGLMWIVIGMIIVMFGIIFNNYQVEKPPLFDKNLYSGLIFNGAVTLYFSFNFFAFLLLNYAATDFGPEVIRLTLAFNNVNNIIKNIVLAFGFYYTNRRLINLPDEEIMKIQWARMKAETEDEE
jgi:drug/metabolite transporter (DMT)-like permease